MAAIENLELLKFYIFSTVNFYHCELILFTDLRKICIYCSCHPINKN